MEPTNQGKGPQEVAKLSQVLQIDEGKIQAHLGEVVRSTVEETLNAMLAAEADRLCRAERYERTEARKEIYAQIEAWRNRPIEGNHPYVFLDGLWLKRGWGGEVRNVSLLVAIRVNDEGFREVLAAAEGSKEDKASWTAFLRHLKERELKGVRLFVSDKCLGLVESLGEFYPEARWQRRRLPNLPEAVSSSAFFHMWRHGLARYPAMFLPGCF
jgi:putative transposase